MADIYIRRKVRNPSGTLFVTFFLGVAIGFTLAYAIFGGDKGVEPPATEPLAVDTAAETTPAPEVPAAEPPPAGSPAEPPAEVPPAEAAPQPEPPKEPEFWPGRLVFASIAGKEINEETAALLKEVRPGAVVLQPNNIDTPEQAAQLVKAIKEAAGSATVPGALPLIVISQEPGINPLGAAAPTPAELGKLNSAEKARDAGRAVAEALSKRGVQVLLGPMLNIPADKKAKMAADAWSFGVKQETVATLGLAYADGLLDKGVVPVVKYYPGVPAAAKAPGTLASLEVDRARLAELMYPFAEAASRNIPGMLAGHYPVPMLDKQEPARPASLSPVVIRRVLRELPNWKYDGVIIADNVAAPELGAIAPPEEAAVRALAAGCDAVLLLDADPAKLRAVATAIGQGMDSGALDKAELAKSAARLDSWNDRLGKPADAVKTLDVVAAEPAAEPAAESAGDGTGGTSGNDGEQPAPPAETAAPAAETAAPAAETPAPAAETAAPAAETPAPAAETPAPAAEAPAPAAEAPAPAAETPAAGEETPAAGEEKSEPDVAKAAEPVAPVEPVPQPPDTDKVLHEVARGETLSGIAQQYGVKSADVAAWNALPDTVVKLGTKLSVYAPKGRKAEAPAPKADAPATDTYEVQVGDNAQQIAGKFGITIKMLVEMNKLADPDDIKIGQKLIVPKLP